MQEDYFEARGFSGARLDEFTSRFPTWWGQVKPFTATAHAQLRTRTVRDLAFVDVETTPCIAERVQSNNPGNDQCICITIQLEGATHWSFQNNLEFINKGDIFLWKSDQNFLLDLKEISRTRTIWIPKGNYFGNLTIFHKEIEKLDENNLFRDLIFSQLLLLHSHAHHMNDAQVSCMVRSISELVIGSARDDGNETPDPDKLYMKIQDVIRSRLDDINLSATSVADELDVSVRQIQRACFAHNTTLSALLREERLRYIAQLLVHPRANRPSLTEMAYEYCFYDLAHFSRTFKARYGISPSDYRTKNS